MAMIKEAHFLNLGRETVVDANLLQIALFRLFWQVLSLQVFWIQCLLQTVSFCCIFRVKIFGGLFRIKLSETAQMIVARVTLIAISVIGVVIA
ncbi:MAG: hypothetical protein ACLRW3_09500 [Eubacterium sp.]